MSFKKKLHSAFPIKKNKLNFDLLTNIKQSFDLKYCGIHCSYFYYNLDNIKYLPPKSRLKDFEKRLYFNCKRV